MGKTRKNAPTASEFGIFAAEVFDKFLADLVLWLPSVLAGKPCVDLLPRSFIVKTKRCEKITRFQERASEDIVAVQDRRAE
jgi:hypothetical protein